MNTKLRFIFGSICLGAIVAACAADSVPTSEGSQVPQQVPDRCATPNDGCACANAGQQIECGTVKEKIGEYTLCQYGVRTCESDNKWGTCLVPADAKLAYVGYGLGLNLNGLGVPASCGNLCDPNCVSTTDTPVGLDAGAGIQITDAGLSIFSDGGSISTCTGVQIMTAEGSTLDTASGPSWTPAAQATIHLTSMVMPSISGGTSARAPLPNVGGTVYPTSGGGNSYVPLKAVLTPVGCDSDGLKGVKFSGLTWSTSRTAHASVGDKGLIGTENVNGLYFFGSVAGPLDVTVQAGAFSSTLKLHVQVDIDYEKGALKSDFGGAETAAAAGTSWLYPLPTTVFPLGLEAPVLMWNKPSSGTENSAAKFRASLVHKDAGGKVDFRWNMYGLEAATKPRATTEAADGEAEYAKALYERNLLAHATDPYGRAAWSAFERTAAVLATTGSPGPATIELARKIGGSGPYRAPDLNLSFVNEALRGRVYFTNYGMRRGSPSSSNWASIWPTERMYDTKAQAVTGDIYANGRNFCPTCHSVSGNGKVFLSTSRGGSSMYPPGVSFLGKDGMARNGWSATESVVGNSGVCWAPSMIDGTDTSRRLCRLNNYGVAGGGDMRVSDGATWAQLRNSDASRVDWYDGDLGAGVYGPVAPGHTWDFSNERIRHQGQWSLIWSYAFNSWDWTSGTRYHARYPHGRNDSANGPAWAAITFDGRYFLQGNNMWGNTWGGSQSNSQTDRYDGTPFRLIEIGRPEILAGSTAETVARWASFSPTWAFDRCTDKFSGTRRFWCDITRNDATGVQGIEGKPLLLPAFSPPSDTTEGAPQTGEVLTAVLGGPTASYGFGGATQGMQSLVVGPVTRANEAVPEKLEGAASTATRNVQELSVGTLSVAARLTGTERFQSVSAGRGGEQLVAQVGTGKMPGVYNACYRDDGAKIAEYVQCGGKPENGFDNSVDHRGGGTNNRYYEPDGLPYRLSRCYSGGSRATACYSGSHTFHDRQAAPMIGVYQRASSSTYKVSVCTGTSYQGVELSDASGISGSAIGNTRWYAYVTGDLSNCTAALSGSALNTGHSSKPRRSVCENDDSYVGLQPFNDGSGTKYWHVCKQKSRYEAIRCSSGASPTYATVNNTPGATDCTATRSTPYEAAADTLLGPAEGEPSSYCIRSSGGRYAVQTCDNLAGNPWATSPCQDDGSGIPAQIPDTGADCTSRGGGRMFDARGGIAGSGFGWVDSYLLKAAPNGGGWSSVRLNALSPTTDLSTPTAKDYFPSMYAESVGGMTWLMFSSARAYGNAYSNNAANTAATGLGNGREAGMCGSTDRSTHFLQTLLWGSALDAPTTANAAADTSHAPFLLPGQQFGMVCANSNTSVDCGDGSSSTNPDCLKRQVSLSERPVWVKAACSATVVGGGGSADNQCEDDKDCCQSSAKCTFDLPPTVSDPYTGMRHCRVPASACGPSDDRTGAACSTNADCCGLLCAGYVCQASACAPQYTSSATYDRVYTASCKTGQSVSWSYVQWSGDAPNNSRLGFYVATADTEAAAKAAAGDGVLVDSATGVTNVSNKSADMSLLSSQARSRAWLRLRMKLDPSTIPDNCSSPAVRAWRVAYTCKDAE